LNIENKKKTETFQNHKKQLAKNRILCICAVNKNTALSAENGKILSQLQ